MHNRHLLASLMKIELYNLKNVCPIMYKSQLNGGFTNFVPVKNMHEIGDHACFSKIYFINGYNQYIPLLTHVLSKYKVICDVKCSAECNEKCDVKK